MRDAAAAEGRLLRRRLAAGRRLLGPPAARCRRDHQPVQLPGDGPVLVLPDRDRGGQHRDPQAEREGSVGRQLDRRAVGRGRASRTASSTSCTATRSRSTGSSSTPTSRPCRSSGPRRSRATSTRPRRGAGKRVQALGGAKNHMVVLPDADLDLAADAAVNAGFGSAGERCMAISVRRRGRRDRPTSSSPKIAERIGELRIGAGRTGADMGPLITAAHREKVASYLDAGVEAGATLVVDGRDARGRRRRRRVLARPDAVRRRDPRDGALHRRDLRAGAVGAPRRDLRRRVGARERQPLRERRRDLHQRRRRGPAVPERGGGRHGRDQRPDPRAGRVLLVRRLEALALRRHPRVRRRRRALLHARQGGDVSRWLDPSHGGVNLGFPKNT